MNAPAPLMSWGQLQAGRPVMVDTMRRFLSQIGCTLRPGSVSGADLALRSFATFLDKHYPDVITVAAVSRIHIEDYKPWLARRPGQRTDTLKPNTRAHRLGQLRMFFIRIEEWGWPEAPDRVPLLLGDLPPQQRCLPKALDDDAASRLLRAAQADRKMSVRVVCEVLLRTGLRVSEFVALPADAIVQIGAGHWLHVPLGKLRDDRYIPLHPHLIDLIGDYRQRHVPTDHQLLLPKENGRPMNRHSVTRALNRAARTAGLTAVHPHQMRHTLATQAINRGMSLEAIAALLGHHSLDMTLRYAKIANRTVADEYFAVTDKVEALYGRPEPLPADLLGAGMSKLRRDTFRLLGNGYCTRPPQLECSYEATCERCTYFQTSIDFLPMLQRQHDDAAAKHQNERQQIFANLLDRARDAS
ncbi:MAG TPA: tyrosine-type recombinase/integrase [Mycobacterium sp.]|jgi:site-specific recombinase XerD